MLLKIIIYISILPLLCDCKILINITVASNKRDAIIKFSGHDNKVVTGREIDLFNISMDNLNRGVKIEMGKIPNTIFLKDPTPYGNLFHKYKWSEVKRHVRVKNIEIIEIKNKQSVLKTNEVENDSVDKTLTKRAIFTFVENNAYSTWSEKGLPDDEISSDVNLNFEGSKFQFKNKWRDTSLKSKVVNFGVSLNGSLIMEPGQIFVRKLIGMKTMFILKIEYVAKLIGNIVCDYEELFGKYHFWAPSIENIMKAARIPNEITTTERMIIWCHTDPKIEMYDKKTGLSVPRRIKKRLFWKFHSKKWQPPVTISNVTCSIGNATSYVTSRVGNVTSRVGNVTCSLGNVSCSVGKVAFSVGNVIPKIDTTDRPGVGFDGCSVGNVTFSVSNVTFSVDNSKSSAGNVTCSVGHVTFGIGNIACRAGNVTYVGNSTTSACNDTSRKSKSKKTCSKG